MSLDSFSTLVDDGADLGFSMALNGGSKLQWRGNFGVNPILSKGEIIAEDIKFNDVWGLFLQGLVDYKWIAGTQFIAFKYQLSYPEEELFFKITEGRLLTKDLTYTSKADTKELALCEIQWVMR